MATIRPFLIRATRSMSMPRAASRSQLLPPGPVSPRPDPLGFEGAVGMGEGAEGPFKPSPFPPLRAASVRYLTGGFHAPESGRKLLVVRFHVSPRLRVDHGRSLAIRLIVLTSHTSREVVLRPHGFFFNLSVHSPFVPSASPKACTVENITTAQHVHTLLETRQVFPCDVSFRGPLACNT